MALPTKLDIGQLYQTPLYQLHHNFERDARNAEEHGRNLDQGARVCGYVIPSFQRGFVWTEAQMIRFVESAFLGLPLGTFTHNTTYHFPLNERRREDGSIYYAGNGWLIDGQQRLTTLHRYFSSEFAVFGLRWSDLTEAEKTGFLMATPFPSYETKIAEEDKCRYLYDVLAYGGTPHQENERAYSAIKI